MTTIRLAAENDILNRHEFRRDHEAATFRCMLRLADPQASGNWKKEPGHARHRKNCYGAGILTRVIPPDVGLASGTPEEDE